MPRFGGCNRLLLSWCYLSDRVVRFQARHFHAAVICIFFKLNWLQRLLAAEPALELFRIARLADDKSDLHLRRINDAAVGARDKLVGSIATGAKIFSAIEASQIGNSVSRQR